MAAGNAGTATASSSGYENGGAEVLNKMAAGNARTATAISSGYENGGAGGKFRRWPFSRNGKTTSYDRHLTALRSRILNKMAAGNAGTATASSSGYENGGAGETNSPSDADAIGESSRLLFRCFCIGFMVI
ncbi:hypothetical protein CQW23_23465 [Capsicum baccatum]|uniref:Uncharacterized protein n=1 Tax=Capsicum baccatum TaxID=33114 RepID=A0A2G2VS19_CAPBA|nr:hypothetical protein CQW23_23465 [Capsicum baccatum]